ncbi:leucyl aminopeptidase [Streptosporangium carneum]|uniref:Probable cytosol aminopeptidase n=1 Tax=Streptosporangium carneum TaxID=47481 RepID=A0A9W6I0C7_9ACTN|nr:leucyl aminopeptidase [Streptosporangium carneum]GLK09378.1 putative cytosol aminopeptidase [Streptosporangium carneum]
MEVSLSCLPAAEITADLLVVPVREGHDPGLGLGGVLEQVRFTGQTGEELLLPRRDGDAFTAGAVLLVGVGAGGDEHAVRRAIGRVAPRLADFPTVAIAFPHVQAVVEGVRLGGYRFDGYKSAPPRQALREVIVLAGEEGGAERDGLARARVVADAVTFARDLVNTPAGDLVPMDLAERARAMAETCGLGVRVLEAAELGEGGFGGILGVGAASANPPCLIEVSHPGDGVSGTVGLAGKGITFDSGGLAIKSLKGMSTMKCDMAGGATMLAVVQAAARLGLPVGVTAVVPAAENMVSGTATRPGDVLTHRNGRTTEVTDTDSEGRLVLADALAYLAEGSPDVLIDAATLTYSVMHALGEEVTGVLGSDGELVGELVAAGARAGEPMWELPLWEPYAERLRSEVADAKNEGGSFADATIAALFLRPFTAGLPWAHLDFAATAYRDRATDLGPAGATGVMVRTLIGYLESRSGA